MHRLIVFLAILVTNNTFAQVVEKEFKVTAAHWEASKKMYRLTVAEKAGVYWAEKKDLNCIKSSIHSKKKVRLKFNVQNLRVEKCNP